MVETFELPKSFGKGRWMTLVVGLAIVIAGVSSFIWIPESCKDRHRVVILTMGLAALVGGFFLFIWFDGVRTHYCEKIAESHIDVRSVSKEMCFDLSEVESLRWSVGPSFRVRLPDRSVVVSVNGQAPSDQLRIIEKFRDGIPSAKQTRWPLFCHRVALRLRDGETARERMWRVASARWPERHVLITRARYEKIAMIFVPLTSVVAILCWQVFDFKALFIIPVALIVFLFVLWQDIPKSGRLGRRGGGTLVIPFISLYALSVFGSRRNGSSEFFPEWISYVLGAAALVWFVRDFSRLVRAQSEEEMFASEVAVEEWERGKRNSAVE